MANLIPPENGASHKLAVLEAKMSLQKQLWQPNVQTFFKWFIGVLDLLCVRCTSLVTKELKIRRSLVKLS